MKTTILGTLILLSLSLIAQTSSDGNGNWNAGPPWDTNITPPDNGDTVYISAGDIITLNVNTTFTTALVIIVRGTLKLDATFVLPSGSQIVVDGGIVTSGNNGFRLEIGAQVWGDLKKNPITGGILTDATLAIKQIDFSINIEGNSHVVTWNIVLANDNLQSIVLERSTDGKNYEEVEKFEIEESNKVVLDKIGGAYKTYFRLKIEDEKDVTYSEVVELLDENYKIEVYPNPFKGEITFTNAFQLNDVKIEIMDILGNKVIDRMLDQSTIETHNLEAGVYFVNIYKDGLFVQNKRLLKK